jgi:segregation and condensation protein A
VKPKQEYNVKLDLFEGPLDLLLYLVAKAEVEIADISVAQIAKQYLEYLDVIRELNIEIASEYLSMAATLTRLKAREVLGEEDEEGLEGGEDEIFTRQQLIDKLLEYKKYKEAAGSLRVYESERYGSYARGKSEEVEVGREEEEVSFGSIGVFDLVSAFKRILDRASRIGGPSRPRRCGSTTASSASSPCFRTPTRCCSRSCSKTTCEDSCS